MKKNSCHYSPEHWKKSMRKTASKNISSPHKPIHEPEIDNFG